MASRTQIYLTDEQRRALDAAAVAQGRSMADIVREALDRYLERGRADSATTLAASFGALPDLEVPSRDEWDR